MKNCIAALTALVLLAGCSNGADEAVKEPEPAAGSVAEAQAEPACEPESPTLESVEIAAGLTSLTTAHGCGRSAEPGDLAEVHYTGWLFDAEAEDNRGEKFDSSVDRGQAFSFPLGAGRCARHFCRSRPTRASWDAVTPSPSPPHRSNCWA